jgi:hypothetical protein
MNDRNPNSLTDDEVLYYANPLRRIIDLHWHQEELLGFTYISPWPRADAMMRIMD